jgi:hypothetical protein
MEMGFEVHIEQGVVSLNRCPSSHDVRGYRNQLARWISGYKGTLATFGAGSLGHVARPAVSYILVSAIRTMIGEVKMNASLSRISRCMLDLARMGLAAPEFIKLLRHSQPDDLLTGCADW